MDNVLDNTEVQYFEHQRNTARGLGLKRLVPINVDTYPAERFEKLWLQIKDQDYAFEDSTRDNPELFAQNMLSPGTYNFEIPGVVFVQLRGASPGSNCEVHFISLSLTPTEPIIQAGQELFWFAFEQIGVHRITALIPEFNKKVERFATLLRMKFEGSLRSCFFYHKEYWNLQAYGILESEWKRRE